MNATDVYTVYRNAMENKLFLDTIEEAAYREIVSHPTAPEILNYHIGENSSIYLIDLACYPALRKRIVPGASYIVVTIDSRNIVRTEWFYMKGSAEGCFRMLVDPSYDPFADDDDEDDDDDYDDRPDHDPYADHEPLELD